MIASVKSSRLAALLCSLAAALGAGCGDNVVNQPSLSIRAFIEGTVVDGVTRQPIENATVSVPGIGADGTVTTDTSGFYSIEVPGVGQHTVFVSADGHARAKYQVLASTEPGAPGNIQLTAVRNSALYPTTGALSGLVVSGGKRNAVGGARVLVQFTDTIDPIEDPTLTLETMTGDDGTFSLTDLPAGSPLTRVTVFATDTGGSPEPDTATFSSLVTGGAGGSTLTPGAENYMTITVDPFVADGVVWSSVDDAATVAVGDSLTLVYARGMDTSFDGTTVSLRDLALAGSLQVAVDSTWSSDDATLTITPQSDLVAGEPYQLDVTARSQAGVIVNYSQGFRVASGNAPGAVDSVQVLTDPIAWNQRTFRIGWTGVADAQSYRVLARGTGNQTAWVTLFEGRFSQFGDLSAAVTLPDSFDMFPDLPAFSPFGFGTSIDFGVQALNGKNEGPFPDQLQTVADDVCPGLAITQSGSAANPLSVPLEVTFTIYTPNGEYLADDSSVDLTFSGNVFGDPLRTERPDPSRIALTYGVPAMMSGAGLTATADVSAVTDTSGNKPDGSTNCPDSLSVITF